MRSAICVWFAAYLGSGVGPNCSTRYILRPVIAPASRRIISIAAYTWYERWLWMDGGVLPFPTHCIGSTVWPNWDRISHLGKINFCLLSERLLMMMLMTMSKTLRSSLNCFFAFSWFSSSGVCKTKQIRGLHSAKQFFIRGLQNNFNDPWATFS